MNMDKFYFFQRNHPCEDDEDNEDNEDNKDILRYNPHRQKCIENIKKINSGEMLAGCHNGLLGHLLQYKYVKSISLKDISNLGNTRYIVNHSDTPVDNFEFYDRNYKNIILCQWKAGAGGLFLSNCLALSDKFNTTFPDLNSKVDFLKNCIKNQHFIWYDFYLAPQTCDIFSDGYYKEKFFFIYDHEYYNLEKHHKFWKRGYTIFFKNEDLFCNLRRVIKNIEGNIYTKSYQIIKDPVAGFPGNLGEFMNLSDKDKFYFMNLYKCMNNVNSHCTLSGKTILVWDTNWFFSENKTVNNIKIFYNMLGLKNFPEDNIRELYQLWISKLIEMSKKEIPHNIEQYVKNPLFYDKPIVSENGEYDGSTWQSRFTSLE